DMLKGVGAVELVSSVMPGNHPAVFVAAFSAVLGHIFPVWLRLRGGKGVATGFGAFLVLTPRAILVASGIFLAMALVFRFVSLASITAAASLPLFAFLLDRVENLGAIASIAGASVLIVIKHHQNIQRLLAASEPKFEIKRR
ncbi:MAG: glycerol-3-phosphate acyltransferase, partial [Acidobacteria bacterium]|nr:glycerol-3-phosphate acyltransferase [Acidobacteriota bacterium]